MVAVSVFYAVLLLKKASRGNSECGTDRSAVEAAACKARCERGKSTLNYLICSEVSSNEKGKKLRQIHYPIIVSRASSAITIERHPMKSQLKGMIFTPSEYLGRIENFRCKALQIVLLPIR